MRTTSSGEVAVLLTPGAGRAAGGVRRASDANIPSRGVRMRAAQRDLAPPLKAPASRWRSGLGSDASEKAVLAAGAGAFAAGGNGLRSALPRRLLSAAAASATSAPTPTPASAAQLRRSDSSNWCRALRSLSSSDLILARPRGTRVRAISGLQGAPPSMPWMMRSLRDARRCPRRMAQARRGQGLRLRALLALTSGGAMRRERRASELPTPRGAREDYGRCTGCRGRTNAYETGKTGRVTSHFHTRTLWKQPPPALCAAQHSSSAAAAPRLKTRKKV